MGGGWGPVRDRSQARVWSATLDILATPDAGSRWIGRFSCLALHAALEAGIAGFEQLRTILATD